MKCPDCALLRPIAKAALELLEQIDGFSITPDDPEFKKLWRVLERAGFKPEPVCVDTEARVKA